MQQSLMRSPLFADLAYVRERGGFSRQQGTPVQSHQREFHKQVF